MIKSSSSKVAKAAEVNETGEVSNSYYILFLSIKSADLSYQPINSDQGADSIFKITLNILCFACALALLRYDDKR